jgi:hypothetical protein
MCFDVPDPDINAIMLPEVGCLEHLIRFSYTRDEAQENFELTTIFLPLLILDTD